MTSMLIVSNSKSASFEDSLFTSAWHLTSASVYPTVSTFTTPSLSASVSTSVLALPRKTCSKVSRILLVFPLQAACRPPAGPPTSASDSQGFSTYTSDSLATIVSSNAAFSRFDGAFLSVLHCCLPLHWSVNQRVNLHLRQGVAVLTSASTCPLACVSTSALAST